MLDGIREAICRAENVLVLTHLGPDGDALGSLTAVGQAIRGLGKQVTLAVDGGPIQRFAYLPMVDEVREDVGSAEYDLMVAVDCGDVERMGECYKQLTEPLPPIINIDHHITNTHFGTHNLITDAASTCEMLYQLFVHMDIAFSQSLAVSLLTGIVTDTLCFRTSNVKPQTLEAASQLMAYGADLPTITSKALNVKPYATIKMWSYGLGKMTLEDGVVWATISKGDRNRAGYEGISNGGLVSVLADVEEAAMSCVLVEMDDGRIGISFRSRPPYDVSQVAVGLGGGGHPQASGCTLSMSLAEAEELVIGKCKIAAFEQGFIPVE